MLEPNDLRDVLAIAQARSLSAAARKLGVDASTMGRRLSALEARLSFALFLRSRGGLKLTSTGTKLVRAAEQQEARLVELERELRSDESALHGAVRLSVAEWGSRVITPILADLARAAPRLTVTLLISNQVVDLAAGEADLALRIGRPTEKTLAARRLGVIEYGVYGSASYLDRRGLPTHAAALRGHDFCVLEGLPARLPHLRWQARLIREGRVTLRTNSMLALLEGTRAAAGLAVLPVILARSCPDLRRVLDGEGKVHNTLWLAFHEKLRRSRLLRATVEHLEARVSPLLQSGAASESPDGYLR